MKSFFRFTHFLGVRAGEHERFALLFAHSLFNGVCTAFLFSSAYALFLDRYDAQDLPWAYIASAVAGYAVVAVFSWLERQLPFKRLLIYQLYFVLVFILTFWGATSLGSARWPVFLMFVSMGPLLTLLELEYWGIAVRLFDLRQGKRLFNLVGVGGVLSSIAGFFLVPILVGAELVRHFEDLLLFAAAGVGFSLMVVRLIYHRFSSELEIKSAAAGEQSRDSFGPLWRERYFVLLAVLVVAFTLAFYLIDLSFLSEVETQYPDGTKLAAFIGQFYGLIKLLELLFKTFLSGRLLSRYGVLFGLTALPVLMLAAGGLAVGAGVLGADAEAFFLAVAALKLIWLVLRKAIYDGAFKVLYQPLQSAARYAYQARLEGTVSPAVTLAVGVGLLIFGRDGFASLQLLSVLLPLLVVWIAAAMLLYREYRALLLDALAKEVEKGGPESPVDTVRARLFEASPARFDYVADVLERVDATAVAPAMVEVVDRDKPELLIPVLRRIRARRDFDAVVAVERCLQADDGQVRSMARKTLRSLQDVVNVTGGSGRISELAQSAEPADRELAALALGWSAANPDDLTGLLWDRAPVVRKAALLAAGRLRDPRFWPRLVANLSSPRFAGTAQTALISVGAPVLPELETAFDKVDQKTPVRLRILNIWEHLGGRAQQLIVDQLQFPDRAVWLRALVSLSHTGYRLGAEERPLIKNQIESVAGIMCWNLAAMIDLGEAPKVLEMREALKDENRRRREELLSLLSLMFDSRAVALVKKNLDSQDREAVVYALEILDVVVSADLRQLLFPVFEQLSVARAAKRLEAFFPRQRMGRLERLRAITFRPRDAMSSWSRACALRALGRLSDGGVDEVMVASLFHPEPMLQEVAAASLFEVDPEDYHRHVGKLPREARERLGQVVMPANPDSGSWLRRSTFGRVAALREVAGFATVPWQALASIAAAAEEIEIDTGSAFPPAGEPTGRLYVIAEGRLGAYTEAGGMGVIGRGLLIAFTETTPPCRVLEAGRAYGLDGNLVYELAAAHEELVEALLEAASPRAVHEVQSLSRSFESAVSFARTLDSSSGLNGCSMASSRANS